MTAKNAVDSRPKNFLTEAKMETFLNPENLSGQRGGFCVFCAPRGNKMVECSRLLQSTIHTRSPASRKDERGVDLISDVLPFGRLWYGGPNAAANAIGYAIHSSRSHNAVIRVYYSAGNMIETHEHKGDFKES